MIDTLIEECSKASKINLPLKDKITLGISSIPAIFNIIVLGITSTEDSHVITASISIFLSIYLLITLNKLYLHNRYETKERLRDLFNPINTQKILLDEKRIENLRKLLEKKGLYTKEKIANLINILDKHIKHTKFLVIHYAIPAAILIPIWSNYIGWRFSKQTDTILLFKTMGSIMALSIMIISMCYAIKSLIESLDIKKQTLINLLKDINHIYLGLLTNKNN